MRLDVVTVAWCLSRLTRSVTCVNVVVTMALSLRVLRFLGACCRRTTSVAVMSLVRIELRTKSVVLVCSWARRVSVPLSVRDLLAIVAVRLRLLRLRKCCEARVRSIRMVTKTNEVIAATCYVVRLAI